MKRSPALWLALLVTLGVAWWGSGIWPFHERDASWKAGVAAIEITPQESMWMSGYAGRKEPSKGTLTPLWAKALALEDPGGNRVLLVTMDVIGIDREFSTKVFQAIEDRHGLSRARVMLNTSHTHTGPVIGGNLQPMYALARDQSRKVEAYTERLHDAVLQVASQALADLAPSELYQGEGKSTSFAANRRENREDQIVELRAKGELKGPIDHSVPVLAVKRGQTVRAVVFGFACHATVLSSLEWSGDYPGFAQAAVEERHPGAVALFWAGCGADVNPLPRRSAALAASYGNDLAQVVDEVLKGPEAMIPIEGSVRVVAEDVLLDFDRVPSDGDLELKTQDENLYVARMAKRLLDRPDLMDLVRQGYPYPVQSWKLGDRLTWVALGGEVVVDYALKIKDQWRHGPESHVWVAGYSNDVMAYIPSQRVLREGGYEGEGAMVYYGWPSPWADDVEARVMAEVERQASVLAKSGQ